MIFLPLIYTWTTLCIGYYGEIFFPQFKKTQVKTGQRLLCTDVISTGCTIYHLEQIWVYESCFQWMGNKKIVKIREKKIFIKPFFPHQISPSPYFFGEASPLTFTHRIRKVSTNIEVAPALDDQKHWIFRKVDPLLDPDCR